MRILKVHNYYVLPGGEDTVFQNEIALLRSYGHEVIEYVESNARIESMNKSLLAIQTIWSNSSYEKLKQCLTATKPDIVHFHNTFPLISPAGYYACKDAGIPVVQTLDNQRLICPAASFYRDGKLCLDCLGKTPPWPGVLHACYHHSHLHTTVVASMLTFHRLFGTWKTKVDIFLCSTQFYKNLFVQVGLPENKIVVMSHFVWRDSQLNLTRKAGNYALFVGRMDPEKGVKTLIESWRDVNFPLKIRGSGPLDSWAREFVRQQGMHQVEFVERLEEQELSDLIKNARFLIVPSEGYYETFGMVIVEAYSRGVPVIASNIGVIPELVGDKYTGLLFESGNTVDLSEKARWMWEHTQERDEMGRNGLALYRERFTPEQCYGTLKQVYQSLIRHE